MNTLQFPSKTFSPADLLLPPARPMAARLRRAALRLGLSGTRFAVNGILRHRFWVRQNKLWEYARGLSCIFSVPRPAGAFRVLDFGGGATIPSFFCASLGCDVLCLDIDTALANWTNRVANRRGWKLHASTHNLVTSPAPADWPLLDAIVSFSVLEHIPKPSQTLVLARLAELLKPGGVFVLTFDFGPEAPVNDAVRDLAEVQRLVAATGLDYLDGDPLTDTGERFVMDRRHPDRRFTFASVFLKKRS
jgi:SAM-dependent methyltransferase